MTVNDTACVLVVDDQETNARLLRDLLSRVGYRVLTAGSGQQALELVHGNEVDLLLLDVVMPGMSGLDVCRALRADERYATLPIVLVTALDARSERTQGLEAGADDFLSKPVDTEELLARVRSLLRIQALVKRTAIQAGELKRLNADLEQRVAEKVAEVQRLARLERLVSPQLAQKIVAGSSDPLASHRRDIVVAFFDLRGFTAFAEVNAPEDVMNVLRAFHEVVGREAHTHRGTIERFAGDGVMVFFNDPEPLPEPCIDAARFAAAVRAGCEPLLEQWRRSGFDLHFGCGMAYGFATLGAVGFADRLDYAAIGTVTNLAARLCSEAKGGEILITTRVANALPASFKVTDAGVYRLKGIRDPIPALLLDATG